MPLQPNTDVMGAQEPVGSPRRQQKNDTLPSGCNKDGRNDWKKKGHHTDNANKPNEAPEPTKIPFTLETSRRPRNYVPAPGQAKTMDALEHPAEKHSHTPRGGTTLKIPKDSRGSIQIHQETDNKIQNNLAEHN